jgi:hypothetical protein
MCELTLTYVSRGRRRTLARVARFIHLVEGENQRLLVARAHEETAEILLSQLGLDFLPELTEEEEDTDPPVPTPNDLSQGISEKGMQVVAEMMNHLAKNIGKTEN